MTQKKRRKTQSEENPVYQRRIEESDLLWLVEEYRKQAHQDPDITVEAFAQQYGIEAKLLRQYLFESNSKRRGITLWHGTTRGRAKSIVKEGFRAKEAGDERIWFTRNPNEARAIAQSRAGGRDEAVVFQCQIDLWNYDEYDTPNPNHYAFKHHTISNAVINKAEGLKKKRIRKSKTTKRERQLVDVGINEASNELVIAYWINIYLKLEGESAVSIHHPAITIIKNWVNAQYSDGRETPICDEEMLHLVMIHLPEYFDWNETHS